MPASALDDPSASAGRGRPADPVVRTLRARAAAHALHGNYEQANESRRALEVHQLAERIKRVVDGAPPLTTAQRDRLALLLRPASGGGHAA